MVKKWDKLPDKMKTEEVRFYYDILQKKQLSLVMKRLFDIVVSAILLILLSPVFIILAIAIKLDSKGPIFYRQERITTYGKQFHIHKFRTMINHADKKGSLVTVKNDNRVTKIGSLIRKCRLDEMGQLIDVLFGKMTFVGTRPEVEKYVNRYAPVMMATLLLPAGVTSEASILYKDEDKFLDGVENVEDIYIEEILPRKMYYNLNSIEKFSFWRDISTMFKTVLAMLGKKYETDISGEEKFINDLKEKIKVI